MARKRKRGKGEGCISKRKNGTWTAVVTLGADENGNQKRRFLYGKTRQEVAQKLNQILNDIQSGNYVEPKKITLGEWLDFWFEEYISNSLKLSTKVSYNLHIKHHIKPKIGHIILQDLHTDMIQRFYNEKLVSGRVDNKGGLHPKTIKNMHNVLHEALERACINGRILKNPCKNTVLPKVTKTEMRYLSQEEQKILIAAANKERLGIGIILDLFTGLRLGELLGLQWKHIDLVNGTLTVKQTLNRLNTFDGTQKTKIVIGTPKSAKSIRKIPLHDIMIKKLKAYRKLQKEDKKFAGDLYEDSGFFICNILGAPLDPRTYTKFFHKLREKAGIEHINFHGLRHSFATRALERGIPIKTISDLLGHASISLTLDLYSHVSMDLKKDTVNKLADLFETEEDLD